MLRHFGIAVLADVRTAPRSRRVPQLDREVLARACKAGGLFYLHIPQLGGWRTPRQGSPNAGWRAEAFRGYADHLATPEFAALVEIAEQRPTAYMCAEADWTRCHRRLVSDALLVRGRRVRHIAGTADSQEHVLTPFAVVDGESVTYPAEGGQGTLL